MDYRKNPTRLEVNDGCIDYKFNYTECVFSLARRLSVDIFITKMTLVA